MCCLFLLLAALSTGNRLCCSLPAHPNCALVTTVPPSLQDIALARPAVWAFVHQIGSPNAVLCLRVPAGQAAQPTGVLFVQRSATCFTRYTYHAQRVDSSQLIGASWQSILAKLGNGHYATECESISTTPTKWLLLAKQGPKLTYSLQFTNYYAPDFTAADRMRLAPALALVRRLMN